MDFIYENELSLSHDLCNEIIEHFENQETGQYEGVTAGGVQKNVKKTVDFVIPKNNIKWNNIEKTLSRELNKNIKEYVNNINLNYIDCNKEQDTTINKFSILQTDTFIFNNFMIQRYLANQGRYIYHNDFQFDNDKQNEGIYR